MAFLHASTIPDFLDSLISLATAFVLGTLIGAGNGNTGTAVAVCARTC